MSESIENSNGKHTEYDWRAVWKRINTTGLRWLLVIGALLIIVIIALAFTTKDTEVRATILAAGIPAVLTFIAVVIQAAVSKQMADIMERQESEMTEQRKAMQEGLDKTQTLIKQNESIVKAAQRQALAAEKNLKQTRTHFEMMERPSLGTRKTPVLINEVVDSQGKLLRVEVIVRIRNTGRVPAISVKTRSSRAILPKGSVPLGGCPEPEIGETPSPQISESVMAIRGVLELPVYPLTPEQYEEIHRGDSVLLIWIVVEYKGNPLQREPYVFEYHSRLVPPSNFVICPTHNKAT